MLSFLRPSTPLGMRTCSVQVAYLHRWRVTVKHLNNLVYATSERIALQVSSQKADANDYHRRGVPWIAVLVCCALSLLAYLQMSSSAQIVISYLAGLVGTAQLVTWMLMAGTWIRWNKAIRKQGISRDTLPTRVSISTYRRRRPGTPLIILINSQKLRHMQHGMRLSVLS